MTALLDRTRSYKTRAPDEVWWYFKYGKYRNKISWFAFQQQPGNVIVEYVGPWSEDKVVAYLERYAHILNDDDRIDLEMWWDHGGLDRLVSERIKQTEEEKRKNEQAEQDWLGEKSEIGLD